MLRLSLAWFILAQHKLSSLIYKMHLVYLIYGKKTKFKNDKLFQTSFFLFSVFMLIKANPLHTSDRRETGIARFN